jgi:hypothetical protein
MERFIARYRPLITGVLCGFDRLVFRGWLIGLVREGGMYTFLKRAGVQLLDFRDYVLATSERVKAVSLAEAREQGRPIQYLQGSKTDKEDLARELLEAHPVGQGLVCALTVVEPCMSFEYHRSQDRRERGLKLRPRKCLYVYKYYRHPVFGWLNARIQTWFPFSVQICLNGREWLARQLEQEGRSDFSRHDNCFTWLGDPEHAQRLMDHQLTIGWPEALDGIARALNPLHEEIFRPWPQQYYWSTYQSEWATDLLFRDPASLAPIYPGLVRHATEHFRSPDVLRFLGRKLRGNFTGEVTSSFKKRHEGVRVKHWVRGNSIKMYDKAGSVLRVETTLAEPKDFKVLRPRQDGPEDKLEWRPLRKGVADLHRRGQVSQQANGAYLDALACVEDDTALAELFDQVSHPTRYRGRRVRALRIGDAQDLALLQAISRGEFATSGLRNRDLRPLLCPTSKTLSPLEVRRLSAKVSRQLRMLRAHGILRKVPKSHRYRLTAKGHLLTAALFAARRASVKQLLACAA